MTIKIVREPAKVGLLKITRETSGVMNNLVCMTVVWVTGSFCYYLISYQFKYMKGNIFIFGIISGLSDILACSLTAFLHEAMGFNKALILSYVLAIYGMVALILVPTEDQLLLSLFILGSKFGISSVFNLAYLGNQLLFPVSMIATSYGVCNAFSRIFTALAPSIAEIKPAYVS